MKYVIKSILLITVLALISCGGKDEKKEKDQIKIGQKPKTEKKVEKPVADEVPISKQATLDEKGVGPIKNLELSPDIDQAMAKAGGELFKNKCTACHKTDRKFIGPAPTGILERRSPEWIMNMILNPEVMVKEDPVAKQLLIEFNGSPMANQGLTEDEARKILEYFRTL
ncbi:c-type cytochrome [Marixanthomonas spongiae]|uniref:Cytochrome C n=1 Tax=Marixanthomonas spongiae TaxID=2174845 RepID=A0A2U0I4G0_9FLAO|nr:cytochrome c [Marixanthomonas spongiae]PVW15870.1 cytochrome C [Marixanthomonas spongiae]